MDLTEKQKILDICYCLLLLGDDFIPIIPTVNVNIIPELISIQEYLSFLTILLEDGDVG